MEEEIEMRNTSGLCKIKTAEYGGSLMSRTKKQFAVSPSYQSFGSYSISRFCTANAKLIYVLQLTVACLRLRCV